MAARLVLAPPMHDVVQHPLGRFSIAVRQLKTRLDDHLMIGDIATPESQTESIGLHPRALVGSQIEQASLDQTLSHVATVAASVHSHGSPDAARHADRPFEASHRCGDQAAR